MKPPYKQKCKSILEYISESNDSLYEGYVYSVGYVKRIPETVFTFNKATRLTESHIVIDEIPDKSKAARYRSVCVTERDKNNLKNKLKDILVSDHGYGTFYLQLKDGKIMLVPNKDNVFIDFETSENTHNVRLIITGQNPETGSANSSDIDFVNFRDAFGNKLADKLEAYMNSGGGGEKKSVNKTNFSFGSYKPWIMFGYQIAPSYFNDPMWGNRDGANTSYTNLSWSSPDVQVPISVVGGIATLGTSLEAQGAIRVIGLLSVTNTVINLSGLDSKIPGYNNTYFKAARDATFIVTDFYKGVPVGVLSIPSTASDIATFYSDFIH